VWLVLPSRARTRNTFAMNRFNIRRLRPYSDSMLHTKVLSSQKVLRFNPLFYFDLCHDLCLSMPEVACCITLSYWLGYPYRYVTCRGPQQRREDDDRFFRFRLEIRPSSDCGSDDEKDWYVMKWPDPFHFKIWRASCRSCYNQPCMSTVFDWEHANDRVDNVR